MKQTSYNYFQPKLVQKTNLFLLLTLVCFLGLDALFYVLDRNETVVPLLLRLLAPQILILGAGLLYKVLFRVPARAMGYRKLDIPSLLLVIPLTWCVMPAVGLVNYISALFTTQRMGGTLQSLSMMDYPYLLLLFLVAVMPAVGEELLFRGVMANVYLRRKGILWAGILSGLLFGAFHMNLNQFSYTLLLGIGFVFLLEGTGSMYAGMLSHFLINAQSITLLYWLNRLMQTVLTEKEMEETLFQQQLTQPMAMGFDMLLVLILFFLAIGGAVLAFLLYRYICKRNGRWQHVRRNLRINGGRGVANWSFWLIMVIALVLMILGEVLV